jgi:hypothetical protein
MFASFECTIFGLAMILLGPIALRLGNKCQALRGWRRKTVIAAVGVPLLLAGTFTEQVLKAYLKTFGYKF